MAYLKDDSGRTFALNSDRMKIGRHPDCEIPLVEAGSVSRYHAEIQRDGEDYLIKDLESRNGTFVNEKSIADDPRSLNEGDKIRVCDVTLRFHQANATVNEEPVKATVDDVNSLGGDLLTRNATMDDRANEVWGFKIDDDTGTFDSRLMTPRPGDIASNPATDDPQESDAVRLSAIIELHRSVDRARDVDQVLAAVLTALFRIFPAADRGFIVLKKADGTLVPRWSRTRQVAEEHTIRISRTIARHVIESKQAVLSHDASEDKLELSQSVADLQIRTLICAPLLDGEGQAFGMIQLDTTKALARFQQADLEILARLSIPAGVAIARALDHEEAVRQQGREQHIRLEKDFQRDVLPFSPPKIDSYEIAVRFDAGTELGADTYDFVQFPDGRIAIIIADIAGRGLSAAFRTMQVSKSVHFWLAERGDPNLAMMAVNDALAKASSETGGPFVTMLLILMDPAQHEFTLVSAGHRLPLIRRGDGSLDPLDSDLVGLPIGILDGLEYQLQRFQLAEGEMLLAYTDGVLHTFDTAGKPFGRTKLADSLGQCQGDASSAIEAIAAEIEQHRTNQARQDDAILLAVHRLT